MIRREETGSIAVLQLAHGKVSALDVELLEAIVAALDDVENSTARAVVLTGTGSSFSAGVDLWRILQGGASYVERFLPRLDAALRRLFLFPRPVVAAVNGHAIAGGCILACACDRSLMAAGNGRIGVPELRVGVPFPAVPLEIVRFALGDRGAAAALSGATWMPEEAMRRGFIDEVVPGDELMERAHAAAADLASIPSDSFRLVKQALRASAIERAERLEAEIGERVVGAWCDPAIHAHIRSYLERTLKRTN